MAKLSLKVVVAGRTYPLSVEEHEVEKVNKAASDINKAIKLLQDNYAVKDMQDLLAMTSLQLAVKEEKKTMDSTASKTLEKVEQELISLSNELDNL